MDAPNDPRPDSAPDQSADQPAEKVSGSSKSHVPGLSTLPEKRPGRRILGLFRGKREPGETA